MVVERQRPTKVSGLVSWETRESQAAVPVNGDR